MPAASSHGRLFRLRTASPGSNAPKPGGAARAQAHGEREQQASREQDATRPGQQRDDEQARGQLDGAALEDRAEWSVERARAHDDDLAEHAGGDQKDVEPQSLPRRRCRKRQLAALLRDLAHERTAARDEEREPRGEHAAAQRSERREREIGRRGLQQRARAEQREGAQRSRPPRR